MPLDARSAKAFQDALREITAAKFAAETEEEIDRLDAVEREIIRARKKEIQGDFASRTFFFNFIAERLGAVNAALTGDPFRDVKRRIQSRLLEIRGNLMDSAVEFLDDIDAALIPDELDDEVGDETAVADAPAPKTTEPENDTVPNVPSPLNAEAIVTPAASAVRADLKADYETLFATCVIRPDRLGSVNWHIGQLKKHRSRYETVGAPLGIPWWFIGAVHMLETGFTFDKHLHNGDLLTDRTVRVPAGRPAEGDPPFSWEDSAQDALTGKDLDNWTEWTAAGALYQWERYNGFGYRREHADVKSPYLWSFSNHYTKGKYVADGQWDPNAVSKQCGAAILIRALVNRGVVVLHP